MRELGRYMGIIRSRFSRASYLGVIFSLIAPILPLLSPIHLFMMNTYPLLSGREHEEENMQKGIESFDLAVHLHEI